MVADSYRRAHVSFSAAAAAAALSPFMNTSQQCARETAREAISICLRRRARTALQGTRACAHCRRLERLLASQSVSSVRASSAGGVMRALQPHHFISRASHLLGPCVTRRRRQKAIVRAAQPTPLPSAPHRPRRKHDAFCYSSSARAPWHLEASTYHFHASDSFVLSYQTQFLYYRYSSLFTFMYRYWNRYSTDIQWVFSLLSKETRKINRWEQIIFAGSRRARQQRQASKFHATLISCFFIYFDAHALHVIRCLISGSIRCF